MTRLLAPLALAACINPTSQMRPTIITTTATPDAAADVAARVLVQQGFTVAQMDHNAGTVVSDWQATNFMLGNGPTGRTAYVVRRFMVTIRALGAQSEVNVAVTVMKCEDPGMVTLDGMNAHSGCQNVDGVTPPDQESLNTMGAEIQRQLGTAPAPAHASADLL